MYGITDEYGPGGSERVLKEMGVTGEEGKQKGWVVDTKVCLYGTGREDMPGRPS